MPANAKPSRLSRERVLAAAIELADREGIAALTMRRLAEELGTSAMSAYHHVANKDQLLGHMVDRVVEALRDVAGDLAQGLAFLLERDHVFRQVAAGARGRCAAREASVQRRLQALQRRAQMPLGRL